MATSKQVGKYSLFSYIYEMPAEEDRIVAMKNEESGLLIALERNRRMRNLHIEADFLLNGNDTEYVEDFDTKKQQKHKIGNTPSYSSITARTVASQLYNSDIASISREKSFDVMLYESDMLSANKENFEESHHNNLFREFSLPNSTTASKRSEQQQQHQYPSCTLAQDEKRYTTIENLDTSDDEEEHKYQSAECLCTSDDEYLDTTSF